MRLPPFQIIHLLYLSADKSSEGHHWLKVGGVLHLMLNTAEKP